MVVILRAKAMEVADLLERKRRQNQRRRAVKLVPKIWMVPNVIFSWIASKKLFRWESKNGVRWQKS